MNGFTSGNGKKFNDDEISEAKESLKLLKMKMGGGFNDGGMNGNSNNNFSTKSNSVISNTSSNANSNYRKPFNPNVITKENTDYNNTINSNKFSMGKNTNSEFMSKKVSETTNNPRQKMKGKFDNSSNNNKKIQPSSKKVPDNNYKTSNFQIEEVDDNRVAKASNTVTNFNELVDRQLEEADDVEDDGIERIECDGCGRKFKEEALEKHGKICKKVFQSKRKAFNTKNMRIIDSEHATILKQKEMEEKKKGKQGNVVAKQNMNNKKAKWKKQSEEFRAIMKSGKTTTGFGTETNFGKGGSKNNLGGKMLGKNVLPSNHVNVPSAITEDYNHCGLCNRRYNENAYIKHLPTCERKNKEATMKSNHLKSQGSTSIGNNSKPNFNVKFGKK